jgi:hypothetical protein
VSKEVEGMNRFSPFPCVYIPLRIHAASDHQCQPAEQQSGRDVEQPPTFTDFLYLINVIPFLHPVSGTIRLFRR